MKPIYLIGCGGVGSWLAPALKRLPDLTVTLIDGDQFEKKNLDRQLFDESKIGQNKADVLAAMHGFESIPEYFAAGVLDGMGIGEETTIIVAADNHPARAAALQFCDDTGALCIVAANEYTDAEAYLYKPQWRGTKSDPRIYYPVILTDHSDDPLRRGIGCVEAATENPQLVVGNMAAAVYAADLLWLHRTQTTDEFTPIHHRKTKLRAWSESHHDKSIL